MRHLLVVTALTASCGLAAAEAYADDIPLFGSGVDGSGKVLAPGNSDPHYVVTKAPSASGFKTPGAAIVATPNPIYFRNDAVGAAGTSWIGIGSNLSNIFAPGDYVFRTTFDLTGLDPATAQITIETMTDDMVGGVDLNGTPTGIVQFGFKGFYAPATVSTGFKAGVNTLDFTVKNLGGSATSMGFRVRMTGTADRLDNDPPVISGATDQTFDFAGSDLQLTPELLGITAEDEIDGEVAVTLSPDTVGLGTHTISATASDAAGNTATVTFVVAVVDADPPEILGVADHTFEFDGSDVELSAGALDIRAVDAIDGLLSVSLSPSAVGLGTHTIVATATDASGNVATAAFTVSVVDTTAPVIASLSATPDEIDAKDTGLVLVTLTAAVSDAGDAAPRVRITGVTSNDKKASDKGKKPDWKITGDLTVELRSEGWDAKTPRTYTIAVECVDAAGNRTTGSITVPVVKERRKKDKDDRCDGRDRKDHRHDKHCDRHDRDDRKDDRKDDRDDRKDDRDDRKDDRDDRKDARDDRKDERDDRKDDRCDDRDDGKRSR